jgi:hypothetical protein
MTCYRQRPPVQIIRHNSSHCDVNVKYKKISQCIINRSCDSDIFHPLHLTCMLFPHIVLLLSDLAEVVTLLTCILDVSSLSLGQVTDYPDLDFYGSSSGPACKCWDCMSHYVTTISSSPSLNHLMLYSLRYSEHHYINYKNK